MLAQSKLTLELRTIITLSLILLATALLFIPSEASAGRYKLKCEGPYQVVQGNLLATPPCENAYIAKVARSYGYKVSAKQVRNNIHKKIQICQHIGSDSRISEYCHQYNNYGRSIGH